MAPRPQGDRQIMCKVSESESITVDSNSAADGGDQWPEVALDAGLSKPSQLQKAAEEIRQVGNTFLCDGMLKEAEEKYTKSLHYLEHARSALDPSLRIPAHLNRAICRMKIKDYVGVCEDCNTVLSLEPQNVKALYRRARAILDSNTTMPVDGTTTVEQLAVAIADLKQAASMTPNDADIVAHLKMALQRQKTMNQKSKLMYKNMFS